MPGQGSSHNSPQLSRFESEPGEGAQGGWGSSKVRLRRCVLDTERRKAEVLQRLGLDDSACSAMELQGSQFWGEPRQILHRWHRRSWEIQSGSIGVYFGLAAEGIALEVSPPISSPHDSKRRHYHGFSHQAHTLSVPLNPAFSGGPWVRLPR
ncbi:hypothetical protein BKA56DRAFT_617325 [Ilyonectria sp. MPI-CAGE-AT-0026]|nr:hypothetical protein BKA56DRAFT_617325 [Ilyonectria sp. MPI-CAGE-AT-0026]